MDTLSPDTLALRRLKETKQQFVSVQEQALFNGRQKALDWLLGLSREYDVCCNQVSARSTGAVLELMKASVRATLDQVAGVDNFPFLAHVFVEELFLVRVAPWCEA